MAQSYFSSRRAALLASVAGLAIAGISWDARSQTANVNTTALSGTTSLFTLNAGDSLTNTATGSITITAAGTQPAVVTGAAGAAFILNQGTIQSLQDPNGVAISIPSATSLGTITNSGTGLIQANGLGANAIFINGGLTELLNSATIQAAGASGVGVNIVSSGSVGSLTNSSAGTIAANNTGGNALSIAGTLGTLLNQGRILANGAGGVGVNVVSGASVGTVTNSGTVQANGSGGTAINVNGGVTTIVNAGTVQANGPGGVAVNIGSTGIVQSLTNAAGGTISANGVGGVAVNIAAGAILNTLQNNGTISASDPTGAAINVVGNVGTINNTGSIIGAVTLASGGGTTVNLNGGTLSGNIQGSFVIGNAVNLNGGTIGAGSTIDALFQLNVNTGVLNAGAGGVVITNGFALNVAPGATLAMNGGTVGEFFGAPINGQNPGVNNGGIVNVGTSIGTINGAYTQTATGQLVVGVTPAGTGAGQLVVNGNAVINSTGPAIALNFGTSLNGPSGTITVMTALGGVTGSPFPTATSNSLNPYFDFPIVTETSAGELGTNVNISFAAPTLPGINSLFNFCTGAQANTGGYNITATCAGVRTVVDNLFVNGNSAAVTSIFSTLRQLSPAQQAQFFTQVQPSQIGAAGALLASALTGNGGLTTAIDDRLYGMGAGDEVGRGLTVWVKPYGEAFTQNAKEGVNGFTASSYGFAAGADMLVRPDVRVGAAISLANSDFSFSGTQSGSTASDLLFQAGLYGAYSKDNFFIDGIGAFGLHWYNTKDTISAFGLQRTANYNGVQFSAKVTGGYDWHLASGMVVTPSLTFEEIHIDSDAHQTSGGGLFDLNVADQHVDVMQLKLGGRVAYPFAQTNGWTFTPEVHAYYVRNLILTRVHSTAAFTLGGSFTVAGPQRDPDLADLGVGLTIMQKGPFALSARYDYVWGQTSSDNQFFLRAKTEF